MRNQITLGQVAVDAKSNQITAIPKLLQAIDISGALVTIDAMGCQTEIATTIIQRQAEYCLPVKRNQTTFYQEIKLYFETHLESDLVNRPVRRFETIERGHAREENRYYFICPVPDHFLSRSRWPQRKAIGMAMSDKIRDGKQINDVRDYIIKRYMAARKFAETVRSHWGIENSLHWQLDVTFKEDQSRVRLGHAEAHFCILHRAASSMLKNETMANVDIKNKRLQAGWDDQYLEKVLFGT